MASTPQAANNLKTAAPPSPYGCDFVQALMKLQRATQVITSTLDLDPLLERVVTDIADSIDCVDVSVWLRDMETDEMVMHDVRGCSQDAKVSRLKIGKQGIVGHVAATGVMWYARDVREDPHYFACEPRTRSQVTLPLLANDEVFGALSVDHFEIDPFSEDQLAIFQALAGHIAVAIQNARLFQRERAVRARMEEEVGEARAIQQALLPRATPLVPGFAFETAWHPAGAVGGDWFDFIDLGEDRYGIVLADVSGKGMPAALLMAATRAILRSLVKIDPSPGRTLTALGQTLTEDFPIGKFVTMIYAVLDARTRQITLASAGHLRPLLINGSSAFLDVDTGLPLGLGKSVYPEHVLTLEPGTHLLFYTDGITEASDAGEEEFGGHRLLEHFHDASAGVEDLILAVQEFERHSTRCDDATAVLIRSR